MNWIITLLKTIGAKTLFKKGADIIGARSKSVSDWEYQAIKQSGGSWKDEWLTIIFTAPFIVLILGSIEYVFFGTTRFMDSATLMITNINALGIDYSNLLLIVTGASFGIYGVGKTINKVRAGNQLQQQAQKKLDEIQFKQRNDQEEKSVRKPKGLDK